jgi:hypothetical protein
LRQTEDDLLNPGWAQRLSEIRVTDYLPEKIEFVAADFGGVVGRLDQCVLHVLGAAAVSPRTYPSKDW